MVVCRYDLVALACKGLHVSTNFGQATYVDELARMKGSSQVKILNNPYEPMHVQQLYAAATEPGEEVSCACALSFCISTRYTVRRKTSWHTYAARAAPSRGESHGIAACLATAGGGKHASARSAVAKTCAYFADLCSPCTLHSTTPHVLARPHVLTRRQ